MTGMYTSWLSWLSASIVAVGAMGCDGSWAPAADAPQFRVAEVAQGGVGQAAARDDAPPELVVRPSESMEVAPDRSTDEVESPRGGKADEARAEVPRRADADPQDDKPPVDAPTETVIAAAEVAPSVTFASPSGPFVSNPVTLSVQTGGSIYRVEYWVDGGSMIGMSMAPSGGFAALFSFWMEGERTLEARAFDQSGQQVAQDQMVYTVPAQSSGTDWGTPPPSSPAGSGGGSDSESAPDTPSSTDEESPACGPGKILDCEGQCANIEWIGDDFCDDGTQYAIDFTCPALGMDGGDCGLQSQSPCGEGEILDCEDQCAKVEWIGDGICDDGSQYAIDFTCPALGMDGGDCAPTTPSNTPTQGGVPYFYQYDNDLHPGSSCQNTSIAMLLAHFGWSGEPDDITASWGKKHAQSPAGLAEVFNHYAETMGIPQRLIARTDGSLADFKALLAQGKPTIVHGYLTSFGHVVLTTGYNGSSYTVNDPAGQWSQSFQGGYPYAGNSTVGHGITYAASSFETAIATLDGSQMAPLWYHELTP